MYAALVLQVTDWVRELSGLPGSRSAVVTQALAWLVGVLAVWIGSAADLTAGLVIPGTSIPLGRLDGPSIVLAGLLLASAASTLVDFRQAIDGSDSAAKPHLLG